MSEQYSFPAHKAGLSLEHNEHKNYYESAEQFIANSELAKDFESPEAMTRAIEADSIWVLQWYPETPVGFHRVAATTLYDVLRLAHQVTQRT